MKILLVYPEYPDTFWGFKYALNFINKKAATPPLGLLTIASMIEEGNELRLVDMNVRHITDEDILWADYVFISAMITQKESTKYVITRCKNLNSMIVAGGPLFSELHDEFPEVNSFLLNEAENCISSLMNDLKKGELKKIYYSDERPDIESVPIPKWDLINLKDYARMTIQFSRGCPFDCEFCNIVTLNGRDPRNKTTEKFMKELNALYDYGWRSSIFVVDDNFISNKSKTKELLKELVKWRKEKKYRGTFMTQISLNMADDEELLVLMQDAGFSAVFIGLETPSNQSLIECGKFQNKNRDMVADVKKVHNYGMEVYGGFIVGFDHDDESIFDTQRKFIQDAGIVVATVGILNALPGTKLYYRMEKEGRLLCESSGDNTDFSTNFKTKIDNEVLVRKYKKLLLSLYSVDNYYNRIYNFLKEYKRHASGKLTLNFVVAFFKSLYILGVKEQSRWYFWKMLALCVFKYPKALHKAITQAVYFAHFEKIFSRDLCDVKVHKQIIPMPQKILSKV